MWFRSLYRSLELGFMEKITSRVVTVCFLAVFTTIPTQLAGELNTDFMASHSVRVIVSDAGRLTASSGFLWKTTNQIVTSLHAIPNRHGITVECRGVKKKAKLVKTLARADLALL